MVTISTDARIDQFSDNSAFATDDWAIDIALVQIQGTTDFAFLPQMGIFVSALTGTWQSFVIGTDGAIFIEDFFIPALLDTWYRVDLTMDTLNGSMTSLITDIALGTTLLNRTDMIAGWTPADGLFDAVAFYGGELTPETTQGNIAIFDNIVVNTVPEPATLALFSLGLAGLGLVLVERGF